MREFLTDVAKRVFKLSAKKDSIVQTERNKFRAELEAEIVEALSAAGLLMTMTIDGPMIELQNDELGVIPAKIKVTIPKQLDYDFAEGEELLREKLDARKKREEEKEAKRKAREGN